MKKTKPTLAIFILLIFLNSCGSVVEGLGGTKKKGSDEFLVEKKAPLVLPPGFGELPEPGLKIEEDSTLSKKNTSSIEEIIGSNSSADNEEKSNEQSDSIIKIIIEKIND